MRAQLVDRLLWNCIDLDIDQVAGQLIEYFLRNILKNRAEQKLFRSIVNKL